MSSSSSSSSAAMLTSASAGTSSLEVSEKESSILSLDQFATLYPLYKMETLLTYKLYCDIMKRNEYVDVKVLDGDEFGIKSYIFTARAFMKNVNRALVPCDADGELDLDWLRSFSIRCMEKTEEFYLCIANFDTVM